MGFVDASIGWILGWTLIHSLWQGALVAGGLALVLRFVPGSLGRLRSAIAWGALALVVGLAAVTWVLVDTEFRAHTACWESDDFARGHALLCASHAVPIAHAELDATLGNGWKDRVATPTSWVSRLALPVPPSVRTASLAATGGMALLAGAGAAFAWLALFRLLCGLGLLRGVLRRSRPVRRSDLDARLRRLADELNVAGPIELRETDDVSTPAVAGWRRSIILVPRGMTDRLTTGQIDDVLIHELAHVRGRHFAVNLAQRTLDALCVFNPFVLWISRRIREEREVHCDRVAAGAADGCRRYVETLIELEQLRGPTSPALLGLLGEGNLLRRIRRLVDASPRTGQTYRRSGGSRRILLAGAAGLATVLVVAQASLTMVSLTSWSVMSHDIAQRRAATPAETAEATGSPGSARAADVLSPS